jgi:mRNA interferase YafQ
LTIKVTSQYKKDFKKAQKQKRNFSELKFILNKIVNRESIPPKYEDHALSGILKGKSDCHIEPDFILIYEIKEDDLILIRLGTHSELFR